MISIQGYAIVCRHDRIADANGAFPPALMNEADWAYFQGELDRADLCVLGSASHRATPNRANRRRLVMSRGAEGLEQRDDAWWWAPAQVSFVEVCTKLLPDGGRIGVPGGQVAFDYFLSESPPGLRFSEFHLSRARHAAVPDGRGLLRAVEAGRDADALLREGGLMPGKTLVIDADAGVDLTVYHRA
ncbi:MAG: hypothetical protein JJU26_02515 [Oceanicaulis sp.]|nr:hypothetical protein [Oceanicaulis sp.]